VKRNFQRDDATAVVAITHGELMGSGVKLFEACAGVGESDSVTRFAADDPFESHTGVAHADTQNFADTNGSEADDAAGSLGFDAMFDGVFDEWLEDECGNHGVEHRGIDGILDAKSVAKPPFLNRKVTTEKIEFATQGNFLFVGGVEGGSQQFAEVSEHVVRSGGVAVNEGRDGVERVEEEMRIELHLECGETGLREAGLSGEGAALALSRALRPYECLPRAKDYCVKEHMQGGTQRWRRATAGNRAFPVFVPGGRLLFPRRQSDAGFWWQ
jgi:hypothetical protein